MLRSWLCSGLAGGMVRTVGKYVKGVDFKAPIRQPGDGEPFYILFLKLFFKCRTF